MFISVPSPLLRLAARAREQRAFLRFFLRLFVMRTGHQFFPYPLDGDALDGQTFLESVAHEPGDFLRACPFAIHDGACHAAAFLDAHIAEFPVCAHLSPSANSGPLSSTGAAWTISIVAPSVIRRRAISTYSGLSSIPVNLRPCQRATSPVVPAPMKGSSTRSPRLEPARMQGSTSFGGNVAKWASPNGWTGMVHTSRLLRRAGAVPAASALSHRMASNMVFVLPAGFSREPL